MPLYHVRTGLLGFALACGAAPPPPAVHLISATPHPGQGEHATAIAADPTVAWGALRHVLAARGIAGQGSDSGGAGRLVVGRLSLSPQHGPDGGECGPIVSRWERMPVRGDVIATVAPRAGGATIRITTRWTATTWDVTRQCEARGSWEQELEREVKQRAERAAKGP